MSKKKIGVIVICLMFIISALLVGCGSSKPATPQPAADPGKAMPVIVSHQPSLHGLPTYLAVKKGWDKADKLDVTVQIYASGPPQNEALASNKWEVGATGSVPGMLAAIRYGAHIIAISNDESETNDLWVRPDSPILKAKNSNPKYPNMLGSAETIKGKTILLTTASTGHYAVIASLRAWGLDEQDIKLVHMEQAQAMAAFEAGQGDIMQSWAPLDYIAESKGWVKISSGKRAGVVIPGVVLASKKAMEENPEKVARWLKIYMQGIQEMKTNPGESAKVLAAYFKENGVTLSESALAQEFKLRPLFNTQEQIALFAKKDGTSTVEKWMTDLADFFVAQGRITPQEKEKFIKGNYIDDKFLKMVAEKEAKK